MNCHRAALAVAGAAGLMTAAAAARVFFGRTVRIVLDAALIGLSTLSALIPGRIITLCMMPDMRCRRIFAPCVAVLAVLTVACAAADILLQRKKTL